VRLAKRLCRITDNGLSIALDALAAAYAEAGQFDIAILTAKKALELALSEDVREQTSGIEKRLWLYRKGHPYRDGAGESNDR